MSSRSQKTICERYWRLNKANISPEGKYVWVKKVQFAMKEKALAQLIEDLKGPNFTLDCFIRDSDMLDRKRVEAADTTRVKEICDSFHQVHMHANRLYAAITRARHADCKASHKVMLHLEQRLPEKSFYRSYGPRTKHRHLSFRLSVSGETTSSSRQACWHETVVTAADG